ncbi:hypothetical protein SGPA1_12226 [Streptomyces misionensis JCM 4497]
MGPDEVDEQAHAEGRLQGALRRAGGDRPPGRHGGPPGLTPGPPDRHPHRVWRSGRMPRRDAGAPTPRLS